MKKQEQNFAEIMSAEEAIAIRKDTEQSIVNGLTEEGAGVYCSFLPETLEDKAKMFNAMNGGDNTVKEANNKELHVLDVIVQPVQVQNEDGTQNTCPRVSLICEDGVYSATSWGVYNCIKKLNALFGGLHFETPVKLIPYEVKTKNGFTINLKMV